MERDKDRKRKARREKFETAHETKAPGRPQQRTSTPRRAAESGDDRVVAADHGEEAGGDEHAPLPRGDRAG